MITDSELKKLQSLVKLYFCEEDSFDKDIKNIVNMFDVLKAIDCDGIEPLRSVHDMHQRFREDKVAVADIVDDLFKNVPEESISKETKCFAVPRVIE